LAHNTDNKVHLLGASENKQDGLRKPTGWPPKVTTKCYYWNFKVETRTHF